MHKCEKSLRYNIERTWRELNLACEIALNLSHKVGKHLEDGASATELVPLLQRELELARNIKSGIHRLATTDGVTLPPTYKNQLTPRIESLMDQQEQNRTLLTQRGVRISV